MQPVNRIQHNLLARGERRLLTWLCARMPGWITPDRLTALGFAGAVMTCSGTALSGHDRDWLWLGVAGYVVNWFGDSLDGSLARFRGIERPRFGYFIDHSTDALATLLIGIGFGLSPYVRFDVAVFVICGYLLLSVHSFLAARVMGEFRLSYVAAGPTELRIALIALSIWMWTAKPGEVALIWGVERYSIFDLLVTGLGIGMVGTFIVQTIASSRRLALMDATHET